MKNKRGFTLIELLSVIVILSLLIALAVPAVVSLMKKAKYNAFKLETESILKIAEVAYADGAVDQYTDSTTYGIKIYCYELDFLKEQGYTDKNFEYPGAVLIKEEVNQTFYLVMYKNDDYKWLVDLTSDNPENNINLYSPVFDYDTSSLYYDTYLDLVSEEDDICSPLIKALG